MLQIGSPYGQFKIRLAGPGAFAANSILTGYVERVGMEDEPVASLARLDFGLSSLLSSMSSSWTWLGTSLTWAQPPSTFQFFDLPRNVAGSVGGSFPSVGNSVLARKNSTSNLIGVASVKGRWFLPGYVIETDVDELGIISVPRRTALNTLLASFVTNLAAVSGPGAPIRLLNIRVVPQPPPVLNIGVKEIVTSVTVDPQMTYLRSRQKRR